MFPQYILYFDTYLCQQFGKMRVLFLNHFQLLEQCMFKVLLGFVLDISDTQQQNP